MAWYRAFLRTDRKRDSKTASDYYCYFFLYFISVRRSLSNSMRVTVTLSITQGTLGNRKGRMAVARVPLNKDA